MKIDLVLEENNTTSFQKAMEAEADKSLKHFEKELLKVRTGRAHTSLVEDILVSCYGQSALPLKSFAALTAPEPRLLTIQPWDPVNIPDIEKAILSSDLGLTPINDGKLIRIQLPEMSSARREELLKVLNKKLEECKIGIRNVRKDFNNLMRDAKKDKKISENFFNRLSDLLQTITDKFCGKADELAEKKKKDIMTV